MAESGEEGEGWQGWDIRRMGLDKLGMELEWSVGQEGMEELGMGSVVCCIVDKGMGCGAGLKWVELEGGFS